MRTRRSAAARRLFAQMSDADALAPIPEVLSCLDRRRSCLALAVQANPSDIETNNSPENKPW
jgi:hypothetical protein